MLTLPIAYVQAAILNLPNPLYTELLPHFVIYIHVYTCICDTFLLDLHTQVITVIVYSRRNLWKLWVMLLASVTPMPARYVYTSIIVCICIHTYTCVYFFSDWYNNNNKMLYIRKWFYVCKQYCDWIFLFYPSIFFHGKLYPMPIHNFFNHDHLKSVKTESFYATCMSSIHWYWLKTSLVILNTVLKFKKYKKLT